MSIPAPLSPLADALARVVAAHRTVRVPIRTLRQAALDADLSLHGSPDTRRRLGDALGELEVAGLIALPAGRDGWEEQPRPRLPLWVARQAEKKQPRPPEPPVAWHAALSWAPAFLTTERPRSGETALLRAMNAFLGRGGSTLDVPLRERSLQLTGDEKALDVLSRGRLFTPGRLSLDLLAAYRTSPPLVRHPVGPGPVTLLVENWTTYHSLSRTLSEDGEIGYLVYGAGNTLGSVLGALADEPPAAMAYFGDLDARGLEIAVAGDRLAVELGLPALRPAAVLYRLLLDHGHRAPVDPVPTGERVRRAVSWLPAAMRSPVRQVLEAGDRMAQEAVGLELLTACPSAALRMVIGETDAGS